MITRQKILKWKKKFFTFGQRLSSPSPLFRLSYCSPDNKDDGGNKDVVHDNDIDDGNEDVDHKDDGGNEMMTMTTKIVIKKNDRRNSRGTLRQKETKGRTREKREKREKQRVKKRKKRVKKRKKRERERKRETKGD